MGPPGHEDEGLKRRYAYDQAIILAHHGIGLHHPPLLASAKEVGELGQIAT